MSETPQASEPVIRVPKSVLLLIGLMLAVQAYIEFGNEAQVIFLMVDYALFPARFFIPEAGLPGGMAQGIFTLVSYGFVHGGWNHVVLNAVWLLAFGTPVARRMGAWRFFTLYFLCLILAGIGQIAVTPLMDAGSVESYFSPIVGASGAISGMMGAAARFVFSDTYRFYVSIAGNRRRLLPLREVRRRPPVMVFILVWLGINLVFGLLGPLGYADPSGATLGIAWVAHLVGFFAGFLLIGVVDRPPLSASGGPGNVDYGDWKKPN